METSVARPPVKNPPIAGPPTASPLSEHHLRTIAEAERRTRSIRNAARVAAFNGYSCAIVAALSAPFALFSLATAVMTIAVSAVAYNEFRGRRLIYRLDVRGPRVLGWNQIALLSVVVGYCVYSIAIACLSPNPYGEYIQRTPELAPYLTPIAKWYVTVTGAVYTVVIVVSIAVQGITARYYFKRERLIREHLARTPHWVTDFQRRAA